MLSRHGTRHPHEDQIEKITKLIDLAKNINSENASLCSEDIKALKKWNFSLTKNDSCILNSQGIRDLSSLGIRLKSVYKDIFDEAYNPTTYQVI